MAVAVGVATTSAASATEPALRVPFFPSASDGLGRQGFARVINHSYEAGEVSIEAFDDEGTSYGPLTLSIDAVETVHFNSRDLEDGNAGKGLVGSTGTGQGDWRLELRSALDIEVLSYIRTTTDGFLTAMHDTVPVEGGRHEVVVFNPGSNRKQESLLRLVNPGDVDAEVSITGTDDNGESPGGGATVTIPAGASRTYTAAELETGDAAGLEGLIGDGSGKWRLVLESEQDIVAMSLLSSPTGHLTNLSTAPDNERDEVHFVPLFPSASDADRRQGFVRVVNRSGETGEVTVHAYDDTDLEYEAPTLAIGANEARHFNSDDLETGSVGKGLTGSTGAGQGDWRLELTSDLDIQVLAYIRTKDDGFLTAMHDLAPREAGRHRVPVFNPGSNVDQRSILRLVNVDTESADISIAGIDGAGRSPGSEVRASLRSGGALTLSAEDLESGMEGLAGALGDGGGKWQLVVESDRRVLAQSLLASPTGHLTNLSTAPIRGAGTSGRPDLLDPGSIDVEWGVWREAVGDVDVGIRFAADFDGDGDDDLLLAGASFAPAGDAAGVILLNNGDFTFAVAEGDRPRGVHPREVVMADFDGDGMNDFFIADHGHDAPPFPGWSNQLILWTEEGYRDAPGGLPDDPDGFTHNAAAGDVDGDGDIDVLVANSNDLGPYFLLNEGDANFVADRSLLPEAVVEDDRLWPWAAELVDLDADGHVDLVTGASGRLDGESFVYWGSATGGYTDGNRTVLGTSAFFIGHGRAEVISTATFDCNGDGRLDLLLGGYDAESLSRRGMQLLVNAGDRKFVDETRRRIGESAWSLAEGWHVEHRFLDFNGDGTEDIVPDRYDNTNVVAWLNDGTGHYVALKTTEFEEEDAAALWRFAHGTIIRDGTTFKAMEFFSDSDELVSNAAVVVAGARVALAD